MNGGSPRPTDDTTRTSHDHARAVLERVRLREIFDDLPLAAVFLDAKGIVVYCNAHLRDLLGNVLTLWFFATPILYPLAQVVDNAPAAARLMKLNPFMHLAVAYQQVLYYDGRYRDWDNLLLIGAASLIVLVLGYFVFDRLRDTLAEAA